VHGDNLLGFVWGVQVMGDIVFVAVTLGFFLLALGYVRGCDRLK
jgi:hypothetical protein